jgi:predicted dehydrogenase
VITYRVNAGTLAASHWYHDRRQGGRLLGEGCHFIDTCSALVGSDPIDVQAMIASQQSEAILGDDIVVMLRYANGSLAVISYASGGSPSGSKERIEVQGRGHTAVINDFIEITLDGQRRKFDRMQKGHADEARALLQAIRLDTHLESDLRSMRAALLANVASSSRSGPYNLGGSRQSDSHHS